MELETRMKRWRLILGEESRPQFGKMGGVELTDEQLLMDQALASIYNQTDSGGFGDGSGKKVPGGRGAGNGPSAPVLSKWLGDVRTLFDKELVTIIQSDAMERCGLKQLLFEPELLENLEPDMNLASMILALKDQIPGRSKDQVRAFISRIVEEINRLLADDIRRAVTAAVDRRRHSPIPSAAALDYKDTIRRNLKNYNPELKRLVPEHFYFYDRTTSNAANKYTVILDVDQSGSMGESVIYSSVISCILASIASVKTRIVAFDTKVTDLTEQCEDPVDLLFGFQLGGGTDIGGALRYCETLIEAPARTIVVLVSDLYEGVSQANMYGAVKDIVESGARLVALTALDRQADPVYDRNAAEKMARLGAHVGAMTPEQLAEWMGKIIA